MCYRRVVFGMVPEPCSCFLEDTLLHIPQHIIYQTLLLHVIEGLDNTDLQNFTFFFLAETK